MAWYTTRKQSQIGLANTVTQRDIAEKTVATQLEIARRANVVESRREWIKELRSAVAEFQSAATALGFLGTNRPNTLESKEKFAADFAEVLRLQAAIVLLLDKTKPTHVDVATIVQAVNQFCLFREGIEEARSKGGADSRFVEARKYPSIGKAFEALDYHVGILIEAAWDKIKKGE